MGAGLYRLAMEPRGAGQPPAALIGDVRGETLASIEHPDAGSIVEQFNALRTIEARNAFGDALLLMIRLLPEGQLYRYEPSGFARDIAPEAGT